MIIIVRKYEKQFRKILAILSIVYGIGYCMQLQKESSNVWLQYDAANAIMDTYDVIKEISERRNTSLWNEHYDQPPQKSEPK